MFFNTIQFFFFFHSVMNFMLSLSGDITGKSSAKIQNFWGLFKKFSNILFEHNTIYQFGIIFIFETYLDTSISSNNKNLRILVYDIWLLYNIWYIILADHPGNFKRGGICIYYKSSLALRILIFGFLTNAWI